MPRLHSGGFINPDFYFNIGTEEARGRDGDTARDAAKKYNDHRHSALLVPSADALRNWVNEFKDISTHPDSDLPGGLIEQDEALLRLPGDIAELNGVLYVMTSSGLRPMSSGFGPHLFLPNDPNTSASIDPDYVCVNYPMLRGTAPNLNGFPCLVGEVNNVTTPVSTTVGSCIIYPSVKAGSGTLSTQVGATAALRVSAPPRTSAGEDIPNPLISIALKIKRFEYNPLTQRILSTASIASDPIAITSFEGAVFDNILNREDRGMSVTAPLLDIPSNFVGKLELEMKFDVENCYSAEDFISVSGPLGLSVEELQSELCIWARDNLFLDLADATARVVCSFGGE